MANKFIIILSAALAIIATATSTSIRVDLQKVPRASAVNLAQSGQTLKQRLEWSYEDEKPAGWNGTFDNRVQL